MIAVSMSLVVVGVITLLLGVLDVGAAPLRFVYASIGSCLAAAVLLAVGVLRDRPTREPELLGRDGARGASWSGALSPPEAAQPMRPQPGEPHVQVLPAASPAPATDPRGNGHDPGGGPEGTTATGTGDGADDEREDARFRAALAGVPVDPHKVERLRGRFATVEGLRAASTAELAAVPGITAELAERIHQRLRAGEDA